MGRLMLSGTILHSKLVLEVLLPHSRLIVSYAITTTIVTKNIPKQV
jgi:hypothetical protein